MLIDKCRYVRYTSINNLVPTPPFPFPTITPWTGTRFLPIILTASFSGHDPHRMVHTYGLHKRPG